MAEFCRQGQQDRRSDREEDPRRRRERPVAALEGGGDPRLVRGDPDLHRLLRQGQRRRTQRLPVELPRKAGRLAARHGIRRRQSLARGLFRNRQGAGGDAAAVDGCRRWSVGVPACAGLRRRSHRAKAVAHLDPRGLETAVRRAGLRRVPEVARQARLCLGVPDVCRQRGAAPAAARHDHAARRVQPGDPRDRHQHPARR